jgi:CHAT domain-containing protein
MNKPIISIVIGFLAITFCSLAYGQIRPAYIENRNLPADTISTNRIDHFIKTQQLDSVLFATNEVGNQFLANGNLSDYLYIMNQTSANIIYVFRNLGLADSLLTVAMHRAIELQDTVQIEFAVLMKYMGVQSFYDYKDLESLQYFLRGYQIMKLLNLKNELFTDFKANVGNSYLNIGEPLKALPYMEETLDESLKFNIPLLYMIVSQGFGHIAYLADIELGIDLFKKVEIDATKLQIDSMSRNKFLANICYMLSGYYGDIQQFDKQREYDKKALKHINNTTIPDLHLRMNIYRSQLYTSIDDQNIELQTTNIKRIRNAITKYDIKEPSLLIPSYYTIGQAFHARKMMDSAYYYLDTCIKMAGDGYSKEKMQLYAMLVKYTDSTEKKAEYAMTTIKLLAPDFDTHNPNNDSIILKNTNNYEFYRDVLPAMNALSDQYFYEDNASNSVDNIRLSLSFLNTLSKVILANTNGIVENTTGLHYSTIYQKVCDDILLRLSTLDKIDKTKNYKAEIASNIAITQSFYLQKQTAFRVRSESAETDSLWNEYFKYMMRKKQNSMMYEQSLLTENPISKEVYQDSLSKIGFKLIKLQLQMNEENLLFSPQLYIAEISEIQKSIKPNEAIINYYISEDSILYTVLIKTDEIKFYSKQMDESFFGLVNQFNRQVQSGEHVLTNENTKLTKILLGNVLTDIENNTKLVIIPHKNLWKIPFELLSIDGQKMLVERQAIAYHTSLNLWKQSVDKHYTGDYSLVSLAPTFIGRNKDLATRDASFEYFSSLYNSDRSSLNNLPYSKLEVEKIAEIFTNAGKESFYLTGKEATETKFKSLATSANILHIATHGYISKNNPEFTGLFFSDNNKIDDAYLFTDEISNIKMSCNLLVLSSCNSGSGIIEGSEGINSLQRYFILAGVPNVAATLWKVHDQKTMDFMLTFYRYLLEGNSYARSLQLTKIDFIKKGSLALDWAGFILIGE